MLGRVALRGRLQARRTRAAIGLLACGAVLSAAALVISLGDATPAGPLALRVLGPPPAMLPATDTPVSTSSPPVAVAIPAIAVSSTLEGLRVDRDGSLQTPHDPSRAGWYADGPAPGDSGAAVIVGHLDSRTGPAVFWKLSTLLRGDRIYVRRADGRTLTFVVDHSTAFPRTNLPAGEVYGALGPELHLITCNGTYDRSIGRYDRSLVVIAKLASSTSPAAPAATPPLPPAQAPPRTRSPAGSGPPSATTRQPAGPVGTPTPASSANRTLAPSPTSGPSPDPPPAPSPTPSPAPTPPPTLRLPSPPPLGSAPPEASSGR